MRKESLLYWMMDRSITVNGIKKIVMEEEGKSISMGQYMRDIGVIIFHMEREE
jgi:hypothetical protein